MSHDKMCLAKANNPGYNTLNKNLTQGILPCLNAVKKN